LGEIWAKVINIWANLIAKSKSCIPENIRSPANILDDMFSYYKKADCINTHEYKRMTFLLHEAKFLDYIYDYFNFSSQGSPPYEN